MVADVGPALVPTLKVVIYVQVLASFMVTVCVPDANPAVTLLVVSAPASTAKL